MPRKSGKDLLLLIFVFIMFLGSLVVFGKVIIYFTGYDVKQHGYGIWVFFTVAYIITWLVIWRIALLCRKDDFHYEAVPDAETQLP